jgi:hypothetical protein
MYPSKNVLSILFLGCELYTTIPARVSHRLLELSGNLELVSFTESQISTALRPCQNLASESLTGVSVP